MTRIDLAVVLVGFGQTWEGYSIVAYRDHVEHKHELTRDKRQRYDEAVAAVCKAVHREFRATRINEATYGNSFPHVHTHVIPRFGARDPIDPAQPIWKAPEKLLKTMASPEQIAEIARRLRHAITGA